MHLFSKIKKWFAPKVSSAASTPDVGLPLATHMEEVSVFPLPNLVLFPGVSLPLHIFEDRYKVMTEDLIHSNKLLAMSLASPDLDGKMQPNQICGAGRIHIQEKFPDGCANVVVEACERIRIVKYVQDKPYLKAMAQVVPDIPFATPDDEARAHSALTHLAARYIFLSTELQDHFIDYLTLFSRPHYLADFIGFHFLPTAAAKQALLETSSQEGRVGSIMKFLEGRIRSLETQPSVSECETRPMTQTVH